MLEQCDFVGRYKYVNSTTLKSEFQLVKHATRMTRQQAKTNAKEKSFMILSIESHKKFLSQIPRSLHYSIRS